MFKTLTTIAALVASSAHADLTLAFDEGAPKDRFTVTNAGSCALPAGTVTIDLGTAPAGLVFDVTRTGAGVQVFQPFEMVAGADYLRATPEVLDGDSAIALDISGLAPGGSIAFTIDVDDTGGASETIVSGAEIAGATLRATFAGQTVTAQVDDTANAVLKLASCTS